MRRVGRVVIAMVASMAARRRVIEVAIAPDELSRLEMIARSRTEAGSRVERARILLAYRAEPSSTAVGAQLGVTHQTVQGCLHRAVRLPPPKPAGAPLPKAHPDFPATSPRDVHARRGAASALRFPGPGGSWRASYRMGRTLSSTRHSPHVAAQPHAVPGLRRAPILPSVTGGPHFAEQGRSALYLP